MRQYHHTLVAVGALAFSNLDLGRGKAKAIVRAKEKAAKANLRAKAT